jgi:hypothetical protein
MDYHSAIERIYTHLDSGDIDKAAMTCLRIARNLKDYPKVASFLYDICDDPQEIKKTFFDDTLDLEDEARKSIRDCALEEWISSRTLDFSFDPNDDSKRLLGTSVGELKPDIHRMEAWLEDMDNSTPYFLLRKSQLRLKIKASETIKQRIKARCLNYAIRLEKQLNTQEKSESFLQTVQNEVNNYFDTNSEDVFTKLLRAAELIDSNNAEDHSLLLTLVRKAIKSVADHFYPPVMELVVCLDGKERQLGEEQYLNRLQEYLAANFAKTSSNDLLRSEFDHLASFARKLNDIASKGVHNDVSAGEAKQGLLGLYMFLYNLISKLQHKRA